MYKRQGIQEALNSGVLAGYPVVDIKVELVDGSYHEVDSSEAAFKVAGSMAVKNALKKATPVILEPMMAVEVELSLIHIWLRRGTSRSMWWRQR